MKRFFSERVARPLRVVVAALLALVVAFLPYLLLHFGLGRFLGTISLAQLLWVGLAAPILGSFVFTTLERAQPVWSHGVLFGVAVGVGFGALLLHPPNLGGIVAYGLLIVFFNLLFGMVGGGFAVVFSRPLLLPCRPGRARWVRPWHLGAAVTVLALVFTAVACVFPVGPGFDAEARALPTALDQQALDVKAETGPASHPPLSAGVPSDSILHVKHWVARADGQGVLHSEGWYDFENDQARTDWFNTPTSLAEDTTTIPTKAANPAILFADVWVHGRHESYNGYSNKILTEPADAPHDFGQEDDWPTEDVVRLGQQSLSGATVEVYRADLNIPRGQERSADFGLVYVKAGSGLRMREEWLIGSPGDAYVAHLYEYDLLPRTDKLERYLSFEGLGDLVTSGP